MKKIRFIAFILLSLIAPIAYLTIRFNLFNTKQTISIWGIVVLGLFLSVLSVIIKYYLDGMKTKYSYLKQVLNGIIKVVLPLGLITIISVWFNSHLDWIQANAHLFTESCIVLFCCESLAMLINPLPKWAFDNNVDGIVEIADKIFKKGE